MEKRPKPARGKAFGILNPYGDMWTYAHFPSRIAALRHISDFWGSIPHDPGRYTVVPVRVTVSALPSRPQSASDATAKPSKTGSVSRTKTNTGEG